MERKRSFIPCSRLRDDIWICAIDDEEREVIGIRTDWTELSNGDFTIYTKSDDKCGYVLNEHGARELICARPQEFESLKRIHHLTEEKD